MKKLLIILVVLAIVLYTALMLYTGALIGYSAKATTPFEQIVAQEL